MVSLADIQISRTYEAADDPAQDLSKVSMESVFTSTGGGGDERRMQVRAYNFWLSLATGDELPAIEDLHPAELDGLGPNGVVLDLTLGRDNPSIIHIGEKLAEACGDSTEFLNAGDVPGRSLLARLTEHGLEVVANRAPVGFDADFIDTHGRLIFYRSILLPFSSDGRTIDFIFGVISWKEDVAAVASAAKPASELSQSLPVEVVVPAIAAKPALSSPLPDIPGLATLLESARCAALAVNDGESRTRAALYAALSGAHDFALAACRNASSYAQLLRDAGLVAQDRAPLVPLVRLVFGLHYDKTRVAEFAAALEFAQRQEIAPGSLGDWLAAVPGGLRAVVAEERRLRRELQGKPARRQELHPAIARKLRKLNPIVPSHELHCGAEFTLLVARRNFSGRIEVLGNLSDEPKLLERAARRLFAR